MIGAVRRWWPLPTVLTAGLVADVVFKNSYGELGEHAAGHLGSASAIFPGLAVITLLLWATPRARRHIGMWLAMSVWLVGLVVVMVGNLRVVYAIGTRDWNEDDLAALGADLPAFEAGHSIAAVGAWIGVAAAVLLAIVLLVRGHVSLRAGIGSVALSVIFPPFIIPGAGMLVLVVAVCVARRRRHESPAQAAEGSVAPQPSYP